MSPFAQAFAEAQDAIYATLGEAAILIDPEGNATEVMVILRRPREAARLTEIDVTRTSPYVRVSAHRVARLGKDWTFNISGRLWKVQAAPSRPDPGHTWVADVADIGDAP